MMHPHPILAAKVVEVPADLVPVWDLDDAEYEELLALERKAALAARTSARIWLVVCAALAVGLPFVIVTGAAHLLP